MAHKTLINGTAYSISGGKTLIDGTAYSIKNGKTLVGGTAYGIEFGGAWVDDLDTGLEFVSASAFTIRVTIVSTVGWDGSMEYCNGESWQTWDGSEISSGSTSKGECIYIRGTGNTKFGSVLLLSGSNIECNGNIENVLDYATVRAGQHPTMAANCYQNMFNGCSNLITAPSLPATTLSKHCYRDMFKGCSNLITAPSLPATKLENYCYESMFYGCSNLITAPSLPATTLGTYCYQYMFNGCSNLKTVPSLPATTLKNYCYQNMFSVILSANKTGSYTKAYRIPVSGTGTTATNSMNAMFKSVSGGNIVITPNINQTYYLDESITIV